MKSKPISEEARNRILDAAWRLIAEAGRADVGQAEIAAAAGVSRQTVFYAFGSRAGLMTATLRRRDAALPFVARFHQIIESGAAGPDAVAEYLGVWLDYLPEVYPVAVLLHCAALTDPEARAAIGDRMEELLGGLRRLVRRMARQGTLPPGRDPDHIAEEIFAAVHVESWRLLVAERGWSPQDFRASRLTFADALLRG